MLFGIIVNQNKIGNMKEEVLIEDIVDQILSNPNSDLKDLIKYPKFPFADNLLNEIERLIKIVDWRIELSLALRHHADCGEGRRVKERFLGRELKSFRRRLKGIIHRENERKEIT